MKNYLKYGVFVSLATIAWTLIMYVLGWDRSDSMKWLGMISWIISVYLIFLGLKEKRDKVLNGFISYGSAFKEGMLISLVSAVIFSVFAFFYYSFVNPGFMDFQKQKTIENLQEQGMDDAQIEKSMSVVEGWMNPTATSITSFFIWLFIGVIISLIVAAIVKKQDPQEIS